MTTVRAGLSPQSETRYFSEKKKSFIPFSDTVAERKNQNGQVPALQGQHEPVAQHLWKKIKCQWVK